MAYQYLKPETIVEVFRTSQQYTEGLTEHFLEYERLSRNKPHASIPKEYPKTTDGTTASIIRKTPHRVIQQLPSGKVVSITEDWLSVVAEFIYTNKIIPFANEGYALLEKCWSVVEKSLSFGFCPTYTPFVEHAGYFCTDLRLPYWGDIFVQPGKLSDADSNYIFMRSWWQTKDIEALIDSQKNLPEKERTWDVEALDKVKNLVITKDDKAKTPHEREMQVNADGGIELITGFQRGVGAKFYTFHVHSTGSGKGQKYTGTIVRTKINKDPRGELPIAFAYGDIDGANPFGRSVIELVGSLQNLMDGEMQMYQYNRALALNPPLIKRGNFNKNKVKFVPNIIIDVGVDPNAGVEPLTVDSSAIANFPDNYSMMKSQLLNLLSSPDTSISSSVGNPGFSKTPAGVQTVNANVSVDDNYVRKQFETWFERWSETAINLYFAERTGVEELQLDKKSAAELRKLAAKGQFDLNQLSDDNRVMIDYDTATPKLKFQIDATTSKVQDDLKQLDALRTVGEILDKSPTLQAVVPEEKQMALWNAVISNSGVKNFDDINITDEEMKAAIQKKQQMEQEQMQMQQQQQQQGDEEPKVIINYKDLPEDVKRQAEQESGYQPSQQASPTQIQAEQKNAQLQQNEQKQHQDLLTNAAKLEQQSQQAELKQASEGQSTKQATDSDKKPKSSKSQPPPKVSTESELGPVEQEPNGSQEPQGEMDPEDIQLIQALQEMEVPEQQIQQAIAMLQAGESPETIMEMLGIQGAPQEELANG